MFGLARGHRKSQRGHGESQRGHGEPLRRTTVYQQPPGHFLFCLLRKDNIARREFQRDP